ncbi:hypothetical protein [Streptomyces sp. NBC_00648]|uniref:hypothetical protein n=1 Tax=Streptomyces sp. NBC_00648 TaxID=2975797 RepID=UPI003243FC34
MTTPPPVVTPRREGRLLIVVCPWCQHEHVHGGGESPGDGDGHRVADCFGDNPGYVIREDRIASQIAEAVARRNRQSEQRAELAAARDRGLAARHQTKLNHPPRT